MPRRADPESRAATPGRRSTASQASPCAPKRCATDPPRRPKFAETTAGAWDRHRTLHLRNATRCDHDLKTRKARTKNRAADDLSQAVGVQVAHGRNPVAQE